jgi:hypothetical protein
VSGLPDAAEAVRCWLEVVGSTAVHSDQTMPGSVSTWGADEVIKWLASSGKIPASKLGAFEDVDGAELLGLCRLFSPRLILCLKLGWLSEWRSVLLTKSGLGLFWWYVGFIANRSQPGRPERVGTIQDESTGA